MMLAGLLQMQGRTLSQATDLEALGMVSTRLLFGAGALQWPLLMEKVVEESMKRDLPISMAQMREELERMFAAPGDFGRMGISFHTVM